DALPISFGISQVFILGGETFPVTAILTLEPECQAVCRFPVQTGKCHVLRGIGQRSAFVLATLLFTVGIGVVGTDAPTGGKLPCRSEEHTLGNGFINIYI